MKKHVETASTSSSCSTCCRLASSPETLRMHQHQHARTCCRFASSTPETLSLLNLFLDDDDDDASSTFLVLMMRICNMFVHVDDDASSTFLVLMMRICNMFVHVDADAVQRVFS